MAKFIPKTHFPMARLRCISALEIFIFSIILLKFYLYLNSNINQDRQASDLDQHLQWLSFNDECTSTMVLHHWSGVEIAKVYACLRTSKLP